MTKLQPLEDRVLILPDEPPKKTESGLYIPETYQDRHQPARGTIVAAGPGKELDGNGVQFKIYELLCEHLGVEKKIKAAMPLNVGDRVLYGHYAGTMVQDPDDPKKEYLVMRLADIMVVL